MVSTSASRQTFITSLLQFMKTYGFDGVDIDWEYPGAPDRGGAIVNTANFVLLLQEMREAFGSAYGISATLPSSYWYLRWFDIQGMEQYLDWFNVMTYDIHGVWVSILIPTDTVETERLIKSCTRTAHTNSRGHTCVLTRT
jgi:chitinase